MEIRVILVDDEEDSNQVLKNLLQKFCPQVTVIGEALNVTDAKILIENLRPDAVFLDIQMPGGNGFSLLKKVKDIPFDVIFVTSYDKYALEAIRLSALHYLLKPIEVEELRNAVERLEKRVLGKELQRNQILNAIHNMEEGDKKITLHTRDQVVFLSLGQITHMESDRNYTIIYTNNREKYISSKHLGEYEEMLNRHEHFFRANKSCIVNIQYITSYSKGEPCMLTIANTCEQEVSRRKKQELLELIKMRE
ncbi:MAG: two component transcriptional regulator, LytTR family [Bacteroidetes bacterium]|jgi:two-component system LytT family response regulator|nr:two component transcriptional regulator, LytTR family [Bacteroidota bacterium]